MGVLGTACSFLFRRRELLLLAALVLLALPSRAERDFAVVRSYDGHFLVTAPDSTTAAAAASLAEVTREAVFDLLAHDNEWPRAASINLRMWEKKTADGEVPMWTISVARDAFRVTEEGVYPSKRNDFLVLQVVGLCLDDIGRGSRPEHKGLPAGTIPLWLSCGVAENLSRENVARLRQFASDTVSNNNFMPIEELFRAKILSSDEAQRELFFKESASVVDFLLHQQDGRSKLKRAIEGCTVEGDFASSLLFAFAGNFVALAQLEGKWKEFAVEQAERTIGAPKMLRSETKSALESVLTVSIPVIDRDTLEEKTVATDLEGLFRHQNRRVVQRIASEKASEIFQLTLRAGPEYAPILQEYLQALTAVGRSDRAAFKRHLAQAERLRKELEKSDLTGAAETEDVNPAD